MTSFIYPYAYLTGVYLESISIRNNVAKAARQLYSGHWLRQDGAIRKGECELGEEEEEEETLIRFRKRSKHV